MNSPRPRAGSPDALYVMLDAVPNPVLTVDLHGEIDYVNEAVLATFGYRREEVIGHHVEMLVPSDLRTSHVQHRAGFRAAPRAREMGAGQDLSAVRRDGSFFPAEITLIPVEVAKKSRVVATVRDITERRAGERRLRRLSRDYLTLAQMNQAIVRAQDEQSLFQETCRIAVEDGSYLGVWVGKESEDGSVVRVASAGTLDDYIAQIYATTDPGDPRGRGPSGTTLRDGRPRYMSDFLGEDATRPWHDLAATYGIAASATLPLRLRDATVATLTFYSAAADVFDDKMRSLLEAMADNVSFALRGFDAADQLRAVARERSELLERLVVAQEDERSRIAADVHDESVQALGAVDLRLGLLRRRINDVTPEFEPALSQLQDTVAVVSAGLRDLLFELEPADAELNLAEMAREAAAYIFDETKVRCSVVLAQDDVDGARMLADTVRGQALRIIKEAMINVRKHAQASQVEVLMTPDDDGIEVQVSDDGVGIGTDLSSEHGHRGIATMLDRAAVAGGWCRVEAQQVGSQVRFWVPYGEAAPRTASTH